MQVYKAFYKIILKNFGQIMIYLVVFISLTVFLTNSGSNTSADFTETKVNIAFINHDTNSKLIKNLKAYLNENTNIVNIPDEKQALQDALFYRQVEYILRIPEGFSDDFLHNKGPVIEKTIVPGSASGRYIDTIINRYLNTAKSYLSNMDHLSEEQLIPYINHDLALETEVILNNPIEETSIIGKRAFFNYMAYSLYAVLILGVSSVMMVFNNTDLKRRNFCSPVKLKNINLQIILGNLSYAVLVWLLLITLSFIMHKEYMFTANGLLLILNSLIFTITVLSISYLIGNVINSKSAMSTVSNVVALGTSFISGVFVPQELLGKTVLRIASFTPNYWYVKSNDRIVKMTNFSIENLKPILLNMAIVMGFGLAVLSITLMVIKQKRMSN